MRFLYNVQMIENGELRARIPADPIEISIPNSIIFPLQHLDDCLSGLEDGAHFSGEALKNFRDSNRFCRGINVAVSVTETAIGFNMLRSKTDGFKGKLSKVGGVLILAHAAVQAKGAFEKSLRQVKLDSKEIISKKDL